jgi:hypothetical protein
MSNTNSFKIVFNSEDNDPIRIPLDTIPIKDGKLNKFVSGEIMKVLLDNDLRDDMKQITYPKGLPKNRKDIISSVEGLVAQLETPINESQVDIWEGSGGFGSKIDEEAFMSEEYLTQRGYNMDSEKDMEVAIEIYELMEDTKKRFKELKE